MKEGSHKKTQRLRKVQNGPPYLSSKKSQIDIKRKDIENIIIKMPAFRVDKFSAVRTKSRSPMLKRTMWNSLALFLVNL